MAQSKIIITDFQRNILENSIIEWNKLFLNTQLTFKEYREIKTILELLGGKWIRWMKCHVFKTETLQEDLEEIIELWEIINVKKLLQQYYTQKKLAEELVSRADIKTTDKVLEPSAWQWALVDEILKENPANRNWREK